MKSRKNVLYWIICAGTFCLAATCADAQISPTALTYNGTLTDGTNGVNGWYDFTLAVFTNATGGAALGNGTQTNSHVAVIGGSFTVTADFGTNLFNGSARWLELAVRTNGGSSFATMSPRYTIGSVPVAQYAMTPAGPQGAQGIQGPQGTAGLNGTNGINGVNGTNGLNGAQGPQGIQGVQGPQGVAGINGTNGVNGTNGATGPQGPQGIQGLQGLAGINGTNGISATITVTNVITGAAGSSATATNLGTATAAVLQFSIPQGLPGTNGADGARGPQGIQGPQGPQGPQGIQGVQGVAGINGTNGLNGLNGTNGQSATITVSNVLTGAAGSSASVTNLGSAQNVVLQFAIPQGLPGANGTDGATGSQGPQGIQGIAGVNGTNGLNASVIITNTITGNPGTAASVTNIGDSQNLVLQFAIPQGLPGTNGADGAQGPQGVAGINGTNGLNGINGTNGLNGADGAQGLPGVPGLVWRSAWDGTTAYNPNDAVAYNGSAFVALLANTNVPPGDGTNWTLLASKGDTGPAGTPPVGTITNNQSGVTLSGTFSGDGSGLTNLSVGNMFTQTFPHGIAVYKTPGTYTWTNPGVSSVLVKLWGGGGGGTSGNGGGGGGYCEGVVQVSNNVQLIVGSGGSSGSNGSDSMFLSITAGGGMSNGNGGQALGTTINVSGGGGKPRLDGSGNSNQNPGGAAGCFPPLPISSSFYIYGSYPYTLYVISGQYPGGGGGLGGVGYDGMVVVYY
jgi:Collagen triple helix repeat (20 copies)